LNSQTIPYATARQSGAMKHRWAH